jgi:hypothetical protein
MLIQIPEDPVRTFLLALSLNSYWQGFFAVVLLANACLMATGAYLDLDRTSKTMQ